MRGGEYARIGICETCEISTCTFIAACYAIPPASHVAKIKCDSRCGVSISGRINAKEGKFPWVVSIADSFDAKKTPFCAGTLINSRIVLTAAECSFTNTKQTAVDKVSVVIGEYDLGSSSESSTYKVMSVSSILVHPSYSISSTINNLALWTLSSAVDTAVYTPVCLPSSDLQVTGTAVIVGWRISSSAGSLNSVLQEETVTLVNIKECGVDNKMLCASQEAACQGDSGGPLLKFKKNVYSLVGSVTSISQCNSLASNGAYMNIPSYVDWIKTQVSKSGGG